MASAARVHAIERGKDPRSLPLFAFGGAGPGARLRRRARPALAAPDRAVRRGRDLGRRLSDGAAGVRLRAQLLRRSSTGSTGTHVNALFDDMAGQGDAILRALGCGRGRARATSRQADVRYAGQGHEVRVDLPDGAPRRRAAWPRSRGDVRAACTGACSAAPVRDVPLEAVSWRLLASGPRPELSSSAQRDGPNERCAQGRARWSTFPSGSEHRPTPVYDRYALAPGTALRRAGDRRGARVDHGRRARRHASKSTTFAQSEHRAL